MLKKLMKYEFMATGRIFLPLFAALIVISVVNRLLSYLSTDTPQIIGTVISVILMVGIFVLTLILTLQRFRNNLLSNEGYLMMTLPVSADRIILSKMFVSAIWIAVSSIVVAASIMIMAMGSFSFSDLVIVLKSFFESFSVPAAQLAAYIIELIFIIALSLFSGILLLYTCMSLSMLVNKRRGLFTFGAFVVITTAMQIISSVLIAVGVALDLQNIFDFSRLNGFAFSQIVILLYLVIDAALCVIFYFVTRFMLKNRLNIQ